MPPPRSALDRIEGADVVQTSSGLQSPQPFPALCIAMIAHFGPFLLSNMVHWRLAAILSYPPFLHQPSFFQIKVPRCWPLEQECAVWNC